jgi:hypothetical protein
MLSSERSASLTIAPPTFSTRSSVAAKARPAA